MKNAEILLEGQKYEGKLDFGTLAKVQAELKKETGAGYTIQEIFEGVQNQDFMVINQIVVCAIQRVHKQVKANSIVEKMNFNNMEEIFKFIADLFEDAMPKEKSNEVGK